MACHDQPWIFERYLSCNVSVPEKKELLQGAAEAGRHPAAKAVQQVKYHHHGQKMGEILQVYTLWKVTCICIKLQPRIYIALVSASERLLDMEDKAKPFFFPFFESLYRLTQRKCLHIDYTFIITQIHVFLSSLGFPR